MGRSHSYDVYDMTDLSRESMLVKRVKNVEDVWASLTKLIQFEWIMVYCSVL